MPVGQAELSRSPLHEPPCTKLHHQVAHRQPFTHVLLRVEFSAGIKGHSSIGDYSGGERDVGGDYQIFRRRLLNDIVVRRIKPFPHHNRFHQMGVMFGKALVRNKTYRHLQTFGRPEDDFFDDPRTRIGVNPYLHNLFHTAKGAFNRRLLRNDNYI